MSVPLTHALPHHAEVRQRDAILEYWEALRHGKDDEALQKLIKLVGDLDQVVQKVCMAG